MTRMSDSKRRAFGKRLRKAREAKGLDLKAVALEASISPQTLRRWEAGKTEPINFCVGIRVISLLHPVDPYWLISGRNQPRPVRHAQSKEN